MLSLMLAVSTATPPDAAAWRPIRTLLENWQFTTEYAISILGPTPRGFCVSVLYHLEPPGSMKSWRKA